MSALSIPVTVYLPPPFVPIRQERDEATKAVLRYLEASADQDDAFDHLVGICMRAVRPYFLADRHGSMTVEGVPQFDNVSGGRTGRDVREEGTALAATREWVQEWLLTFLARYRGRSHDELTAAADNDEFKHLGRQCQLRLLDKLKTQIPRPAHVSLEAAQHIAAKPPAEDLLTCIANIYRAVLANRRELERLDVLDGLLAILGNIEQIESPREYDRLVVESVARRRKVSERSARAYLIRFRTKMAAGLSLNTPAIRAVFLELSLYNADYPVPVRTETEEAPPISRSELTDITQSALRTRGCAWDELDS